MVDTTLAGVTVVALEHAVAAPFATRQLADLGARVIKIERVGEGDFARHYDTAVLGQSSHFVWLNRGKESLELDLKDPADRALLDRILRAADVFVQNLAPGAADRLGLSERRLRAADPRLIVCSISGYGTGGPYADRKAYDLLVQCETGVLAVTGTPDEPARTGIPVADIAAGMYAYSAILAALYERQRTGAGAGLRVSLLDALGEWMSQPYLFGLGGTAAPRTGARHATISPYGPYRTADGTIYLGVQNEREWVRLCTDVLRRPALATDPRFDTNPRRIEHDAVLRGLIEAELSTVSSVEALRRLDAAGIASARLRSVAEFAEHPQLAARDRWREVTTPAGPVRTLLPPVTRDGREPALGPVPALGQHNAAIRAEFGAAGGTVRGAGP